MAMTFREKLEVLIDANAAGFVASMDRAGEAADKNLGKGTQDKLDQLAGKFTVMGAAAVGGASVAAIGLGKLATLAGEAQVAQAKLDNSIANSSQKFTDNGAAVSDLAGQLQKKVAADDESIRSGQAVLVQFGLTEDQVMRLTPLIVDLSRKMGVDLDTAAKTVGKSATGSTGALKKLGIDVASLGEGATDAEKTISALNKSVGGFAQAEGRTFGGQLTILKNQLSELGESVGVGVAGTLQSLVGGLNSVASAANDVNPGITAAIGSLATLGTIGVGSLGALGFAGGQLISLRDNFTGLLRDGEGNLTRFGSKVMDAEGNLTRFGSALKGLAGITIGAAVIGAAIEIGNQFNKASQDVAKFESGLSGLSSGLGGNLTQATADVLNSQVGAVDKWSQDLDKTMKGMDAGERFKRVFTDPISSTLAGWNSILGQNSELTAKWADGTVADLNNAGEALGKLQGNPQALKSFAEGIRTATSDTEEGTAKLGELYTQTMIAYNAAVKGAAGQRDQAAATRETVAATRDAGLATGEYAATAEDLKDVVGELTVSQKTITAAFDANQASAKGFASALGLVTLNAGQWIDSSQAVGKAVQDVFRSGDNGAAAAISALPPAFDAAKAAAGGYTDAQNKAIDGLQQYGAAAQANLSTLLSTGATTEQVQAAAAGYADFIRSQLIPVFKEQGLTTADATAKANAYIGQLGLTPDQVNTQLILGGVEEAKQQLQFLQADFDSIPSEKRAEIYAAVRRGEWDQALKIYNDFKDKTVNLDVQVQYNTRGVTAEATAQRQGRAPGVRADGAVGLPTFAMGGIAEDDDKPEKYAMGGFRGEQKPKARGKLPTQAIIQPSVAGGMVQWAEPETKGEAFIPLAPEKRSRSVDIWEETGRRLGVMPQQQPPRLAVSVQSTQMAAPQVDVPPIEVPPIQVPPAPATQAAQPEASPSISVGAINITEASSGTGTARDVVRKMRDLAFLGA